MAQFIGKNKFSGPLRRCSANELFVGSWRLYYGDMGSFDQQIF
jgi:hypothetical protein